MLCVGRVNGRTVPEPNLRYSGRYLGDLLMLHKTPFSGFPVASLNQTVAMVHALYAGLMAFALVLFVYLEYQKSMTDLPTLLSLVLVLLLILILNLKAYRDVKQGKNKGLWLSRILAVLMLPGFPIGTVLGLIVLWKTLPNQWQS